MANSSIDSACEGVIDSDLSRAVQAIAAGSDKMCERLWTKLDLVDGGKIKYWSRSESRKQ